MNNKYKIRLIRKSTRIVTNGEISNVAFLQIFQKNNRFISEKEMIKICTPYCENEEEAFEKFIEITNVVYDKLSRYNEIIIPNGIIIIEVLLNNGKNIVKKVNNNIREKYGINKFEISKIINEILLDNEATKINNTINNFKKFSKKELELGIKYSEYACKFKYSLKTYPNLYSESAALIKDAISVGIDYKIINEKKGIVEFINAHGKKELVVDGNETNRDSYIFPIITDDKYLTKMILEENNLKCPYGILIKKNMKKEEINSIIQEFTRKPIVIKPRNTNCGVGITIFSTAADEIKIKKALRYAFKFDEDAIIEDYAKGKEYRFLIIGNKCVSIVFRRSASIVGDNKSTIRELIEKKNKEPWHNLTETPIIIDEVSKNFLKNYGYTYDSIIEKDKRVFLRDNSNCSTGGESIDVTDQIPKFFKEKAEQAAKCMKAKISGIDMIIDDLNKKDYNIIEINDTPGYTINEWPYEGNGKAVGIEILRLLGLIK